MRDLGICKSIAAVSRARPKSAYSRNSSICGHILGAKKITLWLYNKLELRPVHNNDKKVREIKLSSQHYLKRNYY